MVVGGRTKPKQKQSPLFMYHAILLGRRRPIILGPWKAQVLRHLPRNAKLCRYFYKWLRTPGGACFSIVRGQLRRTVGSDGRKEMEMWNRKPALCLPGRPVPTRLRHAACPRISRRSNAIQPTLYRTFPYCHFTLLPLCISSLIESFFIAGYLVKYHHQFFSLNDETLQRRVFPLNVLHLI